MKVWYSRIRVRGYECPYDALIVNVRIPEAHMSSFVENTVDDHVKHHKYEWWW